ncbi:hypothetical protein EIP86_009787 [Pleurotus ostreatoroseus]|nr:hypothetical protein EIP86_009787 [Pleurotus ostreatoroseus]
MFTRHWQIVARAAKPCRVNPLPSTSGHPHTRLTLPTPAHQPVAQAGVRARPFSSSVPVRTVEDDSWKLSSPPSPTSFAPPATQDDTQNTLQSQEPRLSLTFTCTVPDCGTRSTHEFSKRSYQRGIVLVQCPGCKNRHLIADHLGWFKESTEDGKLKTIEDLMHAKGEVIRRGRLDAGEVIEYSPD